MKKAHNSSTPSSNRWGKVLLKAIVFLSIFLSVNHIIGEQLDKVAGTTDAYAQAKWEEFYELHSDTLDLVFIGSSYSYRSYDPEVFDNTLGVNSFNMGSPLQKPVESYYVLKETLKYQKPSLVVMDINWGVFNRDKYFNTKLWNFDNMRFSSNKIGFLLNVFDVDQYFYAMFKTMRYHQDTDELLKKMLGMEVENSIDMESYLENYKGKGFIIDNGKVDVGSIEDIFRGYSKNPKEYQWNEKQLKYLDKIVKLCREENIELVFVTAPLSPAYFELYTAYWYDYEHIKATANDLAEKYKVAYLDYNSINVEESLVTNDDFSDSNHLNYNGAQKISRHLADFLLLHKDEYFR